MKTRKEIEKQINEGIDYANPVKVWKGIKELMKLEKEKSDGGKE